MIKKPWNGRPGVTQPRHRLSKSLPGGPVRQGLRLANCHGTNPSGYDCLTTGPCRATPALPHTEPR
jgi:hypothetical protein